MFWVTSTVASPILSRVTSGRTPILLIRRECVVRKLRPLQYIHMMLLFVTVAFSTCAEAGTEEILVVLPARRTDGDASTAFKGCRSSRKIYFRDGKPAHPP